MIKQSSIGLNSRSEANPFNSDGFLPLITAPMYSIVNDSNYQIFLDNKIQVCLPRNINLKKNSPNKNDIFYSGSLQDFIETYIDDPTPIEKIKVCIDTANGNISALHKAIRDAKELHGNTLIIMAGNVASVEAFLELAKTGVDYIRVGIGGGGGCNTTSNTGVGQPNLEELIKLIKYLQTNIINGDPFDKNKLSYSHLYDIDYEELIFTLTKEERQNIINTKIVADGISSYISFCQKEYGFNDNGYAAINKLLFAGADLVMVGKLFAQCLESAGEKRVDSPVLLTEKIQKSYYIKNPDKEEPIWKIWDVKYSGMSTQEEQVKYRPSDNRRTEIKPSEGSVNWIPVRWTLDQWLNGDHKQDEAPYLMGWVNSIKSAMSYLGKTNLN